MASTRLPIRRARYALTALAVLAVSGCSTNTSTTAPTKVETDDDSSTSASTTSTVQPDPLASGIVLIADGSHWGCPGPNCGPDVSRFPTPAYVGSGELVKRGTEVSADCYTKGGSVADEVGATSTDLWIRIADSSESRYMSAHYFGTTDFDSVIEGLPAC